MDRWDGLCAWLALTALAAAAALFVNGPAWAQQDSTTSTLAAPVLTVEADGDAVELRWEAVPGAARYEVWTWTSAGGWERLDDGSLTGTAFRHSGVTAGTTYYYAVRALDANGAEGAWTEFASATPAERETATATSTPTAMSAPAMTPTATTTAVALAAPTLRAEAGAGEVYLEWDAVANAVRYELWAWWDEATGWQRVDDGSLTGTSQVHGGLAAGTTYYYAVRAVDASGAAGATSEQASATVPGAATLTATVTATAKPTSAPVMTTTATATATATATTTPSSASAIAPAVAGAALAAPTMTAEAGAYQIRLKWNAVAGAVRYELWTWWDPVTDWQRLDDGSLTGTAHVHSGLAAGTTYYYAVRAVDASGATSAWSEYASATVPGAGRPTVTATATATPTATAAITGTVTSTPTPTSAAEITGTATPTATPTYCGGDYRRRLLRRQRLRRRFGDGDAYCDANVLRRRLRGRRRLLLRRRLRGRRRLLQRQRLRRRLRGDYANGAEITGTATPTATPAEITGTATPTATPTCGGDYGDGDAYCDAGRERGRDGAGCAEVDGGGGRRRDHAQMGCGCRRGAVRAVDVVG